MAFDALVGALSQQESSKKRQKSAGMEKNYVGSGKRVSLKKSKPKSKRYDKKNHKRRN